MSDQRQQRERKTLKEREWMADRKGYQFTINKGQRAGSMKKRIDPALPPLWPLPNSLQPFRDQQPVYNNDTTTYHDNNSCLKRLPGIFPMIIKYLDFKITDLKPNIFTMKFNPTLQPQFQEFVQFALHDFCKKRNRFRPFDLRDERTIFWEAIIKYPCSFLSVILPRKSVTPGMFFTRIMLIIINILQN